MVGGHPPPLITQMNNMFLSLKFLLNCAARMLKMPFQGPNFKIFIFCIGYVPCPPPPKKRNWPSFCHGVISLRLGSSGNSK